MHKKGLETIVELARNETMTMQYRADDCKQKRAKLKEENNEEDLINQLPDGIPIAILSKLSIEEAARTSILSSKWRSLWTFFSGTLVFDGSPTLKDMKKDLKKATGRHLQMALNVMFDAERQMYVSWINKLLSSLNSPTLRGFKVLFDVGPAFDVDSWVKFAIQKKVEELDLNFGHSYKYTLPLHLFWPMNFNSLRSLRLKYITVTEEMLQYLFCCCPFFENFSLVKCEVPKSTKVSGSSLNLKRLELVECRELRNLHVSAENLVSFKYYGSDLNTEFKSVPNLVEATFGGSNGGFVRESFLSQIKVLNLDITQNAPKVIHWLTQVPKLANLKYLELATCVDDGIALGACALLLKASPSLCRLTLKMLHTKLICRTESQIAIEHQHGLKELELIGFCGAADEIEFVMRVVDRAVELQKLTIDPSLPSHLKLSHLVHPKTWDNEANRKRAWQMKKKIPPWVEFICL